MSIETQINRIKTGVQSAYTELENKGATMPTTLNVDNLASTISNMPAGSTTQADWSVNDETDPSYVKNRPFYKTDPVETELCNGTYETFDIMGDGSLYLMEIPVNQVFDLSLGQEIKVIWDGTEYNLIVQDLEGLPAWGNYSILGDLIGTTLEDTGEPFLVGYDPTAGVIIVYTTTTETEHTVVMSTLTVNIVKIGEEYLPDLIGKSTTGMVYTINDTEVIAEMGAEIFNDYTSNTASGQYSHSEGLQTTASGFASHAEGFTSKAVGESSHAEGSGTASGGNSHAEGSSTTASGTQSHAEGASTTASGQSSHAEGMVSIASGSYSHAEGWQSTASGTASHAEGHLTTASGGYSHAEGSGATVIPSNITSSTDNNTIITSWTSSNFSLAKGSSSHVEGTNCLALGGSSHAEGLATKAIGERAHTEGNRTTASGYDSHAEGRETTASGQYSHAEGQSTTASGERSHAEGNSTTASGDASHAEGYYTKASSQYQHVQGKYNVEDTNNTYAHIVGNGTSDSARSNSHTLDWNGNAWFKGDVYVGGNSQTDGTPIGQLAKKAVHAGISANSNALTTSFMENYLKMANGEAVLEQFIHLSDKVLTMSDLEKGFVISMSEPLEDVDGFASGALVDVMEMPPKAMNEELFTTMVEEVNGMIAIAGACFVVPTDNFTLEGITFPKKGIWAPYYVTSLLVHGYNFNDGAGDLLVEIEDVINLGDTLTWDGNTAGRDIIGDPSMGWIKISDQVITVADCANGGTITLSTGEVNEFTANDIREDTTGFSIGYAVAYFNIPANANVNASSGIYFLASDGGYVASIKINGFNFTTSSTRQEINQKYLPEHLQFGESGGSDTITWDGNTNGRESYANAIFKVSDVVLTSNDCANGGTIIINYAEGDLKTETINFTSADVESNGDALTIRKTLIFSLGAISAKDFNVSPGTYFFKDDTNLSAGGASLGVTTDVWAASLTINGYAGFGKTFIKPIDPKYLPESLQFGEEKPELYGSATVVNGALTWDGNTSGLVSMGNALYLLSDNVSCIELVRKYDNGDEYITVTVEYYNIAAGSTSSVAGKLDSDSGNDALWALNTNSPDVDLDLGVVIAMEDNMTYGPPEMGFTFPKKGLYFLSNSEYRVISLTIDGYDFGAGKITPIDEKLLPEMSSFILKSSTPGSTKKFKITVDDSGTLTATEITS